MKTGLGCGQRSRTVSGPPLITYRSRGGLHTLITRITYTMRAGVQVLI